MYGQANIKFNTDSVDFGNFSYIIEFSYLGSFGKHLCEKEIGHSVRM
jgi:hypothetical protein